MTRKEALTWIFAQLSQTNDALGVHMSGPSFDALVNFFQIKAPAVLALLSVPFFPYHRREIMTASLFYFVGTGTGIGQYMLSVYTGMNRGLS